MSKRLDIRVSDVYNRWTVLSEERQGCKLMYRCVCDCGSIGTIEPSHLSSGKSKSCGCFHKEIVSKNSTVHGKSSSLAYKSWEMMIQRCTNKNNDNYVGYGGVGITVCEEWINSFADFIEDMGERTKGFTLNRKIDPVTLQPYKVYSKETCEWADTTSQSFDKRMLDANTSGKTGVCHTSNGKWRAYISHKGKATHLGTYETYEDAVDSRNKAELLYYGRNKK